MKRKYCLKPSMPDDRDFLNTIPFFAKALPPSVNLNPLCSPVRDQGNLGYCFAFAGSSALEFLQLKELRGRVRPEDAPEEFMNNFSPCSPLFTGYTTHAIEGNTSVDGGATLRDLVSSYVKAGFCREALWPYDPTKFSQKPPADAYSEATQHRISRYERVVGLREIQSALSQGYPVIAGIAVYESFENDDVIQTGNVPMPDPGDACLGGHAIMLTGYDNLSKTVRFRNSWGTQFGDQGYGTLPYAYVQSPGLLMESWTIYL